jgi:hypothetical protein
MGSYWHELPIEPVSAAVDHRTVRLNVGLQNAIPVQVLMDLPAVPVTMHGHALIVLGHPLPKRMVVVLPLLNRGARLAGIEPSLFKMLVALECDASLPRDCKTFFDSCWVCVGLVQEAHSLYGSFSLKLECGYGHPSRCLIHHSRLDNWLLIFSGR